MKSRGRVAFHLRAAVLASLCLVAPLHGESLDELMGQALISMDAKDWEGARDLTQKVIERHGGEDAMMLYGPQFGSVYYRRGLCELKLKRWADAMASFEICYRDFPNTGDGPTNINPFAKLALLKWGEAAMGAEDWPLALSLFEKFSDERDKEKDKFPRGSFYINKAICHYRLNQVVEGNENLEIAMRNKGYFPTPEVGIIAGFQELVRVAVEKKNEAVLLDFIHKNRGELVIEPDKMARYNGVFLTLAGDALAAGMMRSALAVYQFVPSSGAQGDPSDAVKLAGVAYLHEQAGNLPGARAAYWQLVNDYPEAAGREDHLYQLVRVDSLLGRIDQARDTADRLIAEFPQSGKIQELREAGLEIPEKTDAVAAPVRKAAGLTPDPALPDRGEFAVAVDLFQGRKYRDALDTFAAIKSDAESRGEDRLAMLSEFFRIECLRKSGELEAMAREMQGFVRTPDLGTSLTRQMEINTVWATLNESKWEETLKLGSVWDGERLPGAQRAQLAFCKGMALEKLGRASEALDQYQVAITADAGASEDVARKASLGILSIHLADPDVGIALKAGEGESIPMDAELPLREARAVAGLYEMALGAGMPLPQEYRVFVPQKPED